MQNPQAQIKYEIRRSIGGYSVDKKLFGHWFFLIKTKTKKQAKEFVKQELKKNNTLINKQWTQLTLLK